MSVFWTVYELILRMQLSRGRLILFGALGAIALVVTGFATRTTDNPVDDTVVFLSSFGLGLVAPVVALVLGSAVFGDLRDDESLVYLWLRPASRPAIVAAGMAASMSVVIPIVVGPMAVAGLVGAGAEVAAAVALSFTLAVVAYSAIFVLLGLVVRRTLVWGLVYIFIWEFFVARGGAGAARLSINTYPATVLSELTDVALPLAERAFSFGIAVPILVALACLGLAIRRFDTMTVA